MADFIEEARAIQEDILAVDFKERIARRLKTIAKRSWSEGYSGGFYDGRHGGSRDNPYTEESPDADEA